MTIGFGGWDDTAVEIVYCFSNNGRVGVLGFGVDVIEGDGGAADGSGCVKITVVVCAERGEGAVLVFPLVWLDGIGRIGAGCFRAFDVRVWVDGLPYCEETVNVGVMEPEDGVKSGNVKLGAGGS